MSYTFSLSRRSLPVRCLCLLLIVLVLWCFFMVPRAGAVAVEAATVAYAGALVGTILVGAGVVFSSHGDMQKVGAAMYKSWVSSSNAIGTKISALASWAVEHGTAAAKGALRVGKDLYDSVIDSFKSFVSSGIFSSDADSGAASGSFDKYDDLIKYAAENLPLGTPLHTYCYRTVGGVKVPYHFYDCISFTGSAVVHTYGNAISGQPLKMGEEVFNLEKTVAGWEWGYQSYYYRDGFRFTFAYVDETSSTVDVHFFSDWFGPGGKDMYYGNDGPYTLSSAEGTFYPVGTDDIAYPSDDYLVKMPDIPTVDVSTGAAVFPSDAAYTKDAVAVPYPVDMEGVKVPDIPYDKVVDRSTGKTLDDTDTGTDTDKPGTDTDTGTDTGGLLGQIVVLLKNFFDSPSDFRLNMDGFRNLAIKDKFPFCIPFDMVDSVKQFAADAADYQFRIKLDTQYFKVDHVVDLTPLAVPLAFFRYLVVAWFAWVLMSRTHDLMKW